jgi:hypothetical protein
MSGRLRRASAAGDICRTVLDNFEGCCRASGADDAGAGAYASTSTMQEMAAEAFWRLHGRPIAAKLPFHQNSANSGFVVYDGLRGGGVFIKAVDERAALDKLVDAPEADAAMGGLLNAVRRAEPLLARFLPEYVGAFRAPAEVVEVAGATPALVVDFESQQQQPSHMQQQQPSHMQFVAYGAIQLPITLSECLRHPELLPKRLGCLADRPRAVALLGRSCGQLACALGRLGLVYGFVHGDAHDANVLLNVDAQRGSGSARWTVIDFGRSSLAASANTNAIIANEVLKVVAPGEHRVAETALDPNDCATLNQLRDVDWSHAAFTTIAPSEFRSSTAPDTIVSRLRYMNDIATIAYNVVRKLRPHNDVMQHIAVSQNIRIANEASIVPNAKRWLDDPADPFHLLAPGLAWMSLYILSSQSRRTTSAAEVITSHEALVNGGILSHSGHILPHRFSLQLGAFNALLQKHAFAALAAYWNTLHEPALVSDTLACSMRGPAAEEQIQTTPASSARSSSSSQSPSSVIWLLMDTRDLLRSMQSTYSTIPGSDDGVQGQSIAATPDSDNNALHTFFHGGREATTASRPQPRTGGIALPPPKSRHAAHAHAHAAATIIDQLRAMQAQLLRAGPTDNIPKLRQQLTAIAHEAANLLIPTAAKPLKKESQRAVTPLTSHIPSLPADNQQAWARVAAQKRTHFLLPTKTVSSALNTPTDTRPITKGAHTPTRSFRRGKN